MDWVEILAGFASGGTLVGVLQVMASKMRNREQKGIDVNAMTKNIGETYKETLDTFRDYCQSVIADQKETIAEFRLDKTEMGEAIGAAADCELRRANPSAKCPVETENRRRLKRKAARESSCENCIEKDTCAGAER